MSVLGCTGNFEEEREARCSGCRQVIAVEQGEVIAAGRN
jgi:hypothetical protein